MILNTMVVNIISKCVKGMPQNTGLSHSFAAYSTIWQPVLNFNAWIILPSIYIFSSPFHLDWPPHPPTNHPICGYGSKTTRKWNVISPSSRILQLHVLTLYSPVVIICTICIIILELCILSTRCSSVAYGSHNKQRLFPQTALTGWSS
jgi:hypothetical protein